MSGALTFSMLLLSTVGVWAEDCPQPVSVSELVVSLELAEAAQADADLVGLHASTDRATEQLACLQEPITRALAARFHRTLGLRLLLDREMDEARRAFAASRSIEPGYRFPETLVPQGNPVLDEYHALPVENPALQQVPVPRQGYLLFDGREGSQRPVSWPAVVQLCDEDGAVLATSWAWPGDPLPEYVARREPSVSGAHPTSSSHGGMRVGLMVGSGVSAAAAVTLLALSRDASATYYDPSTTGEDELGRLQGQANGLLAASEVATILTAGLGLAVAFTF